MINWIIRETHFKSRTNPLIEELRRQGCPVQVVNQYDTAFDCLYPRESPVMAYGGSKFIRQIQQIYHPGAIATFENFKTESYYPHFRPYLLNKEAEVVQIQSLLTQKERFRDRYGEDVFIRPVTGNKSFSGGIFSLAFLEGQDWVQSYTEAVMVNRPYAIRAEWRAIVANRQVISGGCYVPHLTDYLPPEVIGYVESLPVSWQPDPIYILDVCMVGQDLHVVELNPFSCSDYYRCPVEPIVEWANFLACKFAQGSPCV